MKQVEYIVFRYLTHAEFFNIYKPRGTEKKGGGQSYIDFTTAVGLSDWNKFFAGAPGVKKGKRAQDRPEWTFKVNSLGLGLSQDLTLFQRRSQSVSVSSQKITSTRSERVWAWHPDYSFPQPVDPKDRQQCPDKLGVYAVRTEEGEFWAGWFRDAPPCRDQAAAVQLEDMLPSSPKKGHAGFIAPDTGVLFIHESDSAMPFFVDPARKAKPKAKKPKPKAKKAKPKAKKAKTKPTPTPIQRRPRSEDEITKGLFEEDEAYVSGEKEKKKEVIQKVFNRNTKAVKALKELYEGKCQITGNKYSFTKKDGTRYCEAHHLVPLGNEEGSDSPYNIIIVSPLIHRMLHYAYVSDIDLTKISEGNTLDIEINGQSYTITWHPEHAKNVKKQLQEDNS